MKTKGLLRTGNLFVVLAMLAICSIFATAAGGKKNFQKSWNGYRESTRDGIVEDADWKPWAENSKPKELWSTNVGWGYSTVVIRKGRAYTMGGESNQNRIFCLDAKTGKQNWEYSYRCRTNIGRYKGPRSTPSVDDKYVFTVSQEGHLHCLNVRNGKKIWEKHAKNFRCRPPSWGYSCAPLLHGRNVIYDFGKIIALDKATGRKRWETRDFGSGYSSPVLFQMGSRTCIAAFPRSGLVILDAKNGRLISQFPWNTKYGVNAAMPVVAGKEIFISSGYNAGCAMVTPQKRKCKQLWKNRDMCNHFNTCIYYKGHLYGFSGQANSFRSSELVCLDVKTGSRKWARRGMGAGSLILAGDQLIVLGERGKLVIAPADPDGFDATRTARPIRGRCWTSPTLGEGKLICRNEAGKIVCLDVSGKTDASGSEDSADD